MADDFSELPKVITSCTKNIAIFDAQPNNYKTSHNCRSQLLYCDNRPKSIILLFSLKKKHFDCGRHNNSASIKLKGQLRVSI